jgi:hypothetical protein
MLLLFLPLLAKKSHAEDMIAECFLVPPLTVLERIFD